MKLVKFNLLFLIVSLSGCAGGHQIHLAQERGASLLTELKFMWREEFKLCLREHNMRGGAEPTTWPHPIDACRVHATQVTGHKR